MNTNSQPSFVFSLSSSHWHGLEQSAHFLVCQVLTKSLLPVDLGVLKQSWQTGSLFYPPGDVPTPPSSYGLFPLFSAGLGSMAAVWTAPCGGRLISSAMATGPSSWVLFCIIDRMGFLRKCARKGISVGVSDRGWTLALPFQFCDFWWVTQLSPSSENGSADGHPPIDVLWAWTKDACIRHRSAVGPRGLLLPPFTRLPVSVACRVSG